jgi:hypothetical protein
VQSLEPSSDPHSLPLDHNRGCSSIPSHCLLLFAAFVFLAGKGTSPFVAPKKHVERRKARATARGIRPAARAGNRHQDGTVTCVVVLAGPRSALPAKEIVSGKVPPWGG